MIKNFSHYFFFSFFFLLSSFFLTVDPFLVFFRCGGGGRGEEGRERGEEGRTKGIKILFFSIFFINQVFFSQNFIGW